MFNILDFAALSLHVYKEKKEINQYIPNFVHSLPYAYQTFVNKKHSDGIYEVNLDPSYQWLTSWVFYASLYIKVVNQKPAMGVIAIRGTKTFFNLFIEDIETWGGDVLFHIKELLCMDLFMHLGIKFCQKANSYCTQKLNIPQHMIYITGHSLGGAIASILRAKNNFPNEVVTFNAPGVRTMHGINQNSHGILNIRSRYDFISAIDEPIGPYWDVDVPQKEARAKEAFMIYDKEHNLKTPLLHRIIIGILENVKRDIDMVDSIFAQHGIANLYSALKHQPSSGIAYRNFKSLALSSKAINFDYAAI